MWRFAAAFFFILPSLLLAQEDASWKTTLGISYRNLFVAQKNVRAADENGIIEKKDIIADSNRVRITPEISFGDAFLFHSDVDAGAIAANYIDSSRFNAEWYADDKTDLIDMNWIKEDDPMLYYGAVHRLYVRVNTEYFSAVIGRQQIRFGSGKIWNPLDIMNPLYPGGIEGMEDQKGIDALRADWYCSSRLSLTAGVSARRPYDDGERIGRREISSVGRMKFSGADLDAALIGGYVAGQKAYGGDILVIAGDALLRGSAVGFFPSDAAAYLTANVGWEYSFANGLSLLVEYFHNGNALSRRRSLFEAYTAEKLRTERQYSLIAGRFVTVNTDYAGISAGYDLHPLVRLDLFFISDFSARALFCSPALTINLDDETDLTLSCYYSVKPSDQKESDFDAVKETPLFMLSLLHYF